MDKAFIDGLMENKKNFVFIGEAGSGKTEISLNLAGAIKRRASRAVHFFDMDQTKPLFRARDAAVVLERDSIFFHFQSQYLDAPVVASGVRELLADPDSHVLMDIGGGSHGSHMIGQFADLLNKDDTEILYIINPYRPWSGSIADIEETMRRVLGTAGLRKISLVSNPNLGTHTQAGDVLAGLKKTEQMFPEIPIQFVCALKELVSELSEDCRYPIFPITLATLPEWYC